MTRKIICLVVACLFFVNDICFGLGVQPGSTQPVTRQHMYDEAIKLLAYKHTSRLNLDIPPGNFTGEEFVIDRGAGKKYSIAENVNFNLNVVPGGIPEEWRKSSFFRGLDQMKTDGKVDIIKALKYFMVHEAQIPEGRIEIRPGYFEVDEEHGALPFDRIEKITMDGKTQKYVIIVDTRWIQYWNDLMEHDLWFKYKFPDGETRILSVAWAPFFRMAKHAMTDLNKKDGLSKGRGLGHFTRDSENSPHRDEYLANQIDGRYALPNEAVMLWLTQAYRFGPDTSYDNNKFLERLKWLFEDKKSKELKLPEEFPSLVGDVQNMRLAIELAHAINFNYFSRKKNGRLLAAIKPVIDPECIREYEEREAARKTAGIIEPPIYATGKDGEEIVLAKPKNIDVTGLQGDCSTYLKMSMGGLEGLARKELPGENIDGLSRDALMTRLIERKYGLSPDDKISIRSVSNNVRVVYYNGIFLNEGKADILISEALHGDVRPYMVGRLKSFEIIKKAAPPAATQKPSAQVSAPVNVNQPANISVVVTPAADFLSDIGKGIDQLSIAKKYGLHPGDIINIYATFGGKTGNAKVFYRGVKEINGKACVFVSPTNNPTKEVPIPDLIGYAIPAKAQAAQGALAVKAQEEPVSPPAASKPAVAEQPTADGTDYYGRLPWQQKRCVDNMLITHPSWDNLPCKNILAKIMLFRGDETARAALIQEVRGVLKVDEGRANKLIAEYSAAVKSTDSGFEAPTTTVAADAVNHPIRIPDNALKKIGVAKGAVKNKNGYTAVVTGTNRIFVLDPDGSIIISDKSASSGWRFCETGDRIVIIDGNNSAVVFDLNNVQKPVGTFNVPYVPSVIRFAEDNEIRLIFKGTDRGQYVINLTSNDDGWKLAKSPDNISDDDLQNRINNYRLQVAAELCPVVVSGMPGQERPIAMPFGEAGLGDLATHPLVNALLGMALEKWAEGILPGFVGYDRENEIYWFGEDGADSTFADIFEKLARYYAVDKNNVTSEDRKWVVMMIISRAKSSGEIFFLLNPEDILSDAFVADLKKRLGNQRAHSGVERGAIFAMKNDIESVERIFEHERIERGIHTMVVINCFAGDDFNEKLAKFREWRRTPTQKVKIFFSNVSIGDVDIDITGRDGTGEEMTYNEFADWAHSIVEEESSLPPDSGGMPFNAKPLPAAGPYSDLLGFEAPIASVANGAQGQASAAAAPAKPRPEDINALIGSAIADPGTEESTVREISAMGSAAIPILTKIISDTNWDSRSAAEVTGLRIAIKALGEIGPAARETAPILMRTPQFNYDEIAACLVETLKKIGITDKDIIHALIKTLRYDGSESVIGILGSFGPAAVTAIPALIERAGHGGRYMESVVPEAIANMGRAAVPVLLEMSVAGSCLHDMPRTKNRELSAIAIALATIDSRHPDRTPSGRKLSSIMSGITLAHSDRKGILELFAVALGHKSGGTGLKTKDYMVEAIVPDRLYRISNISMQSESTFLFIEGKNDFRILNPEDPIPPSILTVLNGTDAADIALVTTPVTASVWQSIRSIIESNDIRWAEGRRLAPEDIEAFSITKLVVGGGGGYIVYDGRRSDIVKISSDKGTYYMIPGGSIPEPISAPVTAKSDNGQYEWSMGEDLKEDFQKFIADWDTRVAPTINPGILKNDGEKISIKTGNGMFRFSLAQKSTQIKGWDEETIETLIGSTTLNAGEFGYPKDAITIRQTGFGARRVLMIRPESIEVDFLDKDDNVKDSRIVMTQRPLEAIRFNPGTSRLTLVVSEEAGKFLAANGCNSLMFVDIAESTQNAPIVNSLNPSRPEISHKQQTSQPVSQPAPAKAPFPSAGSTEQNTAIAEIIDQYAIRLGLGIGPGSDEITVQDLECIYKTVNLLNESKIEIYWPQRHSLTVNMQAAVKDIGKRNGKSNVVCREYADIRKLGQLLLTADPSAKKIIITDISTGESAKRDQDDMMYALTEYPNLFAFTRLLNIAIPENYSKMNVDEKTVFQADVITKTILARLYEKDKTPFVEALLRTMLEGTIKCSVDDFMAGLAAAGDTEGLDFNRTEDRQIFIKRFSFLLDQAISIVEKIGQQIRVLKAIWTAA